MTPESVGILYYIVIILAVLTWISFIAIIISFLFNIIIFHKLLKQLKNNNEIETYNKLVFNDKINNIMYNGINTRIIGWIHPRIFKYLKNYMNKDSEGIKKYKKLLKLGIYIFYIGWTMAIIVLILGFISAIVFKGYY